MDHARELELRFFGRVAASFTHELKNVLAIVKETAGLMEDLLAMTPQGAFPHQPRFQRGVGTILEQVSRGVELATRMNRLAHSPDHSLATIDLNEAVDQVCLLSERLARVKGVTLGAEAAPVPVTVVSCPMTFLLSLFKAYEVLWSHLGPGSHVLGKVEWEPRAMVTLGWSGEAAGDADFRGELSRSGEWQDLLTAMETIESRVAWEDDGTLVLEFPRELTR